MLEVAIVSTKCALRDEFPEFKEYFNARAWEPAKEAENGENTEPAATDADSAKDAENTAETANTRDAASAEEIANTREVSDAALDRLSNSDKENELPEMPLGEAADGGAGDEA